MASNNKSNKNYAGVLGAIGAVAGLVQAASPMVEKAMDKSKDKSDKTDIKVIIPDLYRKDFPIDLDQAKILLSDSGLKYSESKMVVKDADKKYKDCFNFQVIASSPKQGTSVNQGTTVYLKYITQEVIDASIKIFEDEEKAKAELKEQKAIEKQERRDHRKEKVSEVTDKVRNTISHVFKKGELKDE